MQISDKLIEEALLACKTEPIHIPGSIQAFGMLLVVDKKDYRIVQVSENTTEFLGIKPEKILGLTLDDVISPEQAKKLLSMYSLHSQDTVQSTIIDIEGKAFYTTVHNSDNFLIIELEFVKDQFYIGTNFFSNECRKFTIGIRKCADIQELYKLVVESIRSLTGFDRVSFYRFDDEWNGEVVAESCAKHIPTFLGLHFPASDIPEQARILYKKNYIRMISDVNYFPVRIIPQLNPINQQPLDMSMISLRSVSPIHIQYLKNMDVQSSMSISIIKNDELWGLITCHHSSPFHITPNIRITAERFGHIFSAQLAIMDRFNIQVMNMKRQAILDKLYIGLELNKNIIDFFKNNNNIFLEIIDAQGVAFVIEKQIWTYGICPNKVSINALITWLEANSKEEIFETQNTSKNFAGIPILESLNGGILIAKVGKLKTSYIMWFRESIIEKVRWAGSPKKLLSKTDRGYHLSPRKSFELWEEKVKSKSLPWNLDDTQTALKIVQIVLEVKSAISERVNNAKSTFLANISHELRTPLNGIIGISDLLISSELSEKQIKYVKIIQESSAHLLLLLNSILDLSKIESGKIQLSYLRFNLQNLIKEVLSLYSKAATDKNIDVILNYLPSTTTEFFGDEVKIKQIFINLINNAIKFTEHGKITILVKTKNIDEEKSEINIEVADTGIGIPSDKLEIIFNKFEQVENSPTRMFSGTGLGLTICKELVELMEGKIKVTSKVAEGSKFSFSIKLKKYISSTMSDKKVLLINKKILLIIDDNKALDILENALEHLGAKCIKFEDQNIEEFLTKHEFDLIIIDNLALDRLTPFLNYIKNNSAKKVFLASKISNINKFSIFSYGFSAIVELNDDENALVHEITNLLSHSNIKDNFGTTGLQQKTNCSLKVLVVEDNVINLEIAKTMLEKLGCRVVAYNNAQEGFNIYTREDFDILFVDLHMPEIGGRELVQRIRNYEEQNNKKTTTIIAYTADLNQITKQECLEIGFNDFLYKPITFIQLEEIINKYNYVLQNSIYNKIL